MAIVDAYDNPTAESDLATYRSQFHLPTCSTANGCFKKLDQEGGTNYPTSNSGWSIESDLDIEAVSAACPKCRITLVEADDDSSDNLYAAVDLATAVGAPVVSLSWGGPEYSGETQDDSHFSTPGISIVAAAGDCGYNGYAASTDCPTGTPSSGAQYPAASPYVISAGGTTLTTAANARGWSESVWTDPPGIHQGGTNSGCSDSFVGEPKPSWQHDAGCSNRMVNDVSADADPGTGLAGYTPEDGGWTALGGTSLSAPLIAGIIASSGSWGDAPGTYGAYNIYNSWTTTDVTSGNNGSCPSNPYFCTAVAGYDGPTGMGSPWVAPQERDPITPSSWDPGLSATVASGNSPVHAWGMRQTAGAWGTGPVNYISGGTTTSRVTGNGALSFTMLGTYCPNGVCSYGTGSGYKGFVQLWNDPSDYIAFGLIHDPGVSPTGTTLMIEGAANGTPVGGYWQANALPGAVHSITASWGPEGVSFCLDGSVTLGPYPLNITQPSVSFLAAGRQTGDISDVTFTNIVF